MVIHSNTWHVHGYTWQYMAIYSDVSDHFSQFCILKSIRDKIKIKKSKVRDFSRFSRDSFNADLSNVDWNALLNKKPCDADNVFSSFYNKFNKLINKHAPMKTISNRKAKQLSKPWITKGIRISIKVKNKSYASGDTAPIIKSIETKFIP